MSFGSIVRLRAPRRVLLLLLHHLILGLDPAVSARAVAAEEEGPLVLHHDSGARPVAFAAGEIRAACAARGMPLVEAPLESLIGGASAGRRIVIVAGAERGRSISSLLGTRVPEHGPGPGGEHGTEKGLPKAADTDRPQSYAIRRLDAAGGPAWLILGADEAGAMYGGLDVAEAIRLGALDELRDADRAPWIEKRGIKLNIPLDARTPSYSDSSHAAQQNIPEMWSMDFWRSFLDAMARHRFNVLTLWSLHPFPSMVKVPEFPEVALDDVCRTTLPLDDTFSHTGTDMVRPAMLERLEVVKRIPIAEKIRFWRDVMELARDRGIEVYIFTWNIFTFGATGKHGITTSQANPATLAYFRASVREMVLSYPLLAGFGVTAGENMERGGENTERGGDGIPGEKGPSKEKRLSKERWLWNAYGEGIRDAKRLQPWRRVRLIHRYHMTAQDEILREWKDYPDTLDLSFKYAIAHMYSVPNPPFIQAALPHLGDGLRTWLTVRNDDIYSFRWGDPAFARAFIRAMPGPDKVVGFYMGPDGYTWGREFLSTEPETPRELVIEKQWYSFMLWGRLGFDPSLGDDLFLRTLAVRFPEVPAADLLDAWSAASKVFPEITRFFWGDIDLRWFPEACISHPRHRGFYTVRHFIEGTTMPGSGILDILAWREKALGGGTIEGATPSDVADALAAHAGKALRLLDDLRAGLGSTERTSEERTSKELRLTLGDIEAMARLGTYYAEKIRGACDLALFDRTGRAEDRDSAVRHLEAALAAWREYAAAYSRQYRPALYNRVGFVDIPELIEKARADVEMAAAWKPGTIPAGAPRDRSADVPFRR